MASALKGTAIRDGRVIPSTLHLEAHENFIKQTWRNRFIFAGAGGVESLSYPVIHDGTRLITEVRVDYSTPWVAKTKKALDSAYYTSAYFEYYRDDLFAVFDSRPQTLWELNLSLLGFLLGGMNLRLEIVPTTSFVPPPSPTEEDLRYVIHPKKPDTVLSDLGLGREYFQVFRDKYHFLPNLSCADLLFNEGPDSMMYLLPSLRSPS